MPVKTRRSGDQRNPWWRVLLAGMPGAGMTRFGAELPGAYFLTTPGTQLRSAHVPFCQVANVSDLTEVIAACALPPDERAQELGSPTHVLVVDGIDGIDRLLRRDPDKLRMLLETFSSLPLDVLLLCHLRLQGGVEPDLSIGANVGSYVDMALLLRATATTGLDGSPRRVHSVHAWPDATNPWVVDHTGQLPAGMDVVELAGALRPAPTTPTTPTTAEPPAPPTQAATPTAPAATVETPPAKRRRTRAVAPAPEPAPVPASEPPTPPSPLDEDDEDDEGDEGEDELDDEDELERPPCGLCGEPVSEDAQDLSEMRRQHLPPPDGVGKLLCIVCGPREWEKKAGERAKAAPRRRRTRPAPEPPQPPPPSDDVGSGGPTAALPSGQVVGQVKTRDPVMAKALAEDSGWSAAAGPSAEELRRMLLD